MRKAKHRHQRDLPDRSRFRDSENKAKGGKMKSIIVTMIAISQMAFAQERQISLFGVTLHGTSANKKAAEEMKHKITSDGLLALNPQINLTFSDGEKIKNMSVLLDCYKNPAAFFGVGKKYLVTEKLELGYIGGIYIRQFPNNEEFKLGKIGNYQVIPTPSLIAQYRIGDKTKIRMSSNYFINFFDIAFDF